jgi:hypothetical protein
MRINQKFISAFGERDHMPWLRKEPESLQEALIKLEWLENTSLETQFPKDMSEEECVHWLSEIFEKWGVREFVESFPKMYPYITYWAYIERMKLPLQKHGVTTLLEGLPSVSRDTSRRALLEEWAKGTNVPSERQTDKVANDVIDIFYSTVCDYKQNPDDFVLGMRLKCGNTKAGDVLVARVINRFIKTMFVFN